MEQTNRMDRGTAAVGTLSLGIGRSQEEGEGGLADVALLSLGGLVLSLALICKFLSPMAIELIQQAWLL